MSATAPVMAWHCDRTGLPERSGIGSGVIYRVETPTANWVDSIAGALRSPTLQNALHHFAHALHTLAGVGCVEAAFSLQGAAMLATCNCHAERETARFISCTEITEKGVVGSATSRGVANYLLIECFMDFEMTLRLAIALTREAPEVAEHRPGALDDVRPLLQLTAERLCTLAQVRLAAVPGVAAEANRGIDLFYTRIGADLLSPRERQVLGGLLGAQSPKTIARELSISPGTVRNHMRHIYTKLHVSSRPELLSRMIRAVLGTPSNGTAKTQENPSGASDAWTGSLKLQADARDAGGTL